MVPKKFVVAKKIQISKNLGSGRFRSKKIVEHAKNEILVPEMFESRKIFKSQILGPEKC